MTLYKSYQIVGGTEAWVTCHATDNLDAIRPTFITALACDTLIQKDSPKQMVEDAKYQGPMYFDLDSKDLTEAIDGAKELWGKLQTHGLTETDVEIYLSGKKGLHFIIPPQVFMEKVVPLAKLPAIYKEIAFNLAVDTLDFSVYSARKGRMFRTHYNVRENGNYKVQITASELMALDDVYYQTLCSGARNLTPATPVFRGKLAIMFEGIKQKLAALKKKPSKPVDATTLRKHLPTIQRLMSGEGVKSGVGFNKIAIQLGIYAHEAKLSEDELIAQCEGLLEKHSGDGYRYDNSSKREHELRRMFAYLEESSGYDYSLGPIQSMLESVSAGTTQEAAADFGTDTDSTGGIFSDGQNYLASSEQGDKHIMDAIFTNVEVLKLPDTEEIALIACGIKLPGQKSSPIRLERDSFASGSSLHKAVSIKGAAFTGNDVQARYIFTLMLREAKVNGATIYGTTCEGLDVLAMPMSEIEEVRKPFLCWTDASGVRLPKRVEDTGIQVRFAPDPGPEGVMKTDIAKAPTFPAWCAEADGNKQLMVNTLLSMLCCQESAAVANLVGWMTASYFTQLFRKCFNAFPLLHIAGPAGTGKTQMVEAVMHLFYHNGEPVLQAASSSIFSISTCLAGSASIPVVIDEYKPHEMQGQKINDLRSLLRSSYNGHSISRGGGNRSNTSFRALSSVKLSGPVVFMAEAMETETAVLHRSVYISLKRLPNNMSSRSAKHWAMFKSNQNVLSIIGQHLAASVIASYSLEEFRADFGQILDKAVERFAPPEEGSDVVLTTSQLMVRKNINSRVIFNYAVSEFGLRIFESAVNRMLPDQVELFKEPFSNMMEAVYNDVDKVVGNSMPEFARVLVALSDMTRFIVGDPNRLGRGMDYEAMNVGGMDVIALVGRLCYNKYRTYCKIVNVPPLYMNDLSFCQSLKDSPIFFSVGTGTKGIKQDTLLLDYEELQRMGIAPFA